MQIISKEITVEEQKNNKIDIDRVFNDLKDFFIEQISLKDSLVDRRKKNLNGEMLNTKNLKQSLKDKKSKMMELSVSYEKNILKYNLMEVIIELFNNEMFNFSEDSKLQIRYLLNNLDSVDVSTLNKQLKYLNEVKQNLYKRS